MTKMTSAMTEDDPDLLKYEISSKALNDNAIVISMLYFQFILSLSIVFSGQTKGHRAKPEHLDAFQTSYPAEGPW